MRFVTTLENEQPASSGDALASACLFGIVGGLLFAVAIAPAAGAIVLGGIIGAMVGIVVAYQ